MKLWAGLFFFLSTLAQAQIASETISLPSPEVTFTLYPYASSCWLYTGQPADTLTAHVDLNGEKHAFSGHFTTGNDQPDQTFTVTASLADGQGNVAAYSEVWMWHRNTRSCWCTEVSGSLTINPQ
jgi:hypothetical protein